MSSSLNLAPMAKLPIAATTAKTQLDTAKAFSYNMPKSTSTPTNNENVNTMNQPQFVSKYAQQLYQQ